MYKITVGSNELYHYGVLGMHWGVRRYQNYDGTRISTGGKPVIDATKVAGENFRNTIVGGQGGKAKGLERLAAVNPKAAENLVKKDSSDTDNKDDTKPGFFDRTIKRGKDKEKSSPAEEVSRGIRDTANNSKSLIDVIEKHDPKTKQRSEDFSKEAQKMSDKQLRDQINRIKMEREYVSLKQSEVDTGYARAREVLDVVGDVASITLSVLGIIAMIKGAKMKQADFSLEEAELKRLLNLGEYDDEFIAHAMDLDQEYVEDYLEHHGVLGMKWGVRRYQNYDGSSIGVGEKPVVDKSKQTTGDKKDRVRDETKFTSEQKRVSKDARKDAEEFARAKAFYGEGAGNRRKAIKTTVEAKKKKSSFYAEEFEWHLSQQDMEKHMREAKAERNRKDGQKRAQRAGRDLRRGIDIASRFL